jgi:Protein of unknown function (DUF1706)
MTSSNSQTQIELEALIAEFNRVRAELIAGVASVPPDLRDEVFVGSWGVEDVIAHTVGWDYTNIEALPDFRSGRLPDFFARYDADWAAINAALVARYRIEDWGALMTSLRESQRVFVDAMRGLNDADLDNVAMWGKRRITLRGMIRAVCRDESEHVAQVRAFISGRAP